MFSTVLLYFQKNQQNNNKKIHAFSSACCPPLDATVLSDPVAVLGGPGVNAGLVPTTAAIPPAHHTSEKDPPTGAGDRQRAPRVALCADI